MVCSVLLLVGCRGGDPNLLPEGCNPLTGGQDCLLPFPSDFHTIADSTAPTGLRVDIADAAEIESSGGRVDVSEALAVDGFSRTTPVAAMFDQPVARGDLVSYLGSPADAAQPDHPTLLIDTSTGELVPHYVDLDPEVDGALILYAVVPLKPQTRYVVSIRGLLTPDGDPVRPAPGYASLRDGHAGRDPNVKALVSHYENDIFPVLEDAGVDRADTQLVWDFTVGSSEPLTRDMLRVRELTLAWLASNTPVVTIDNVETDPDPEIWRRVHGTVTGPLFTDTNEPGALLVRDTDGNVVQNGTASFEFVAQIPVDVRDAAVPGRVLEYGHGFFGRRSEMTDSQAIRTLVNDQQMVGFAIDWAGMMADDVLPLIDVLTSDLERTTEFTDRVHQAMANWLVMSEAIRGPLATESAFQRPGNAELVYDPASINFLGISMGHLLGGVLAALDPNLERVCLNVGGAGLTHIMTRSGAFAPFLDLISGQLPTPTERLKFLVSIQEPLGRIDGVEYADWVVSSPLPQTQVNRAVLMQIGVGDASFPNAPSYLHARALGLDLIGPSPVEPYGFTATAGPLGSALTIFDFGVDTSGLDEPVPPEGNGVHEGVRSQPEAQAQMGAFFQPDGQVVQMCAGPCDPD